MKSVQLFTMVVALAGIAACNAVRPASAPVVTEPEPTAVAPEFKPQYYTSRLFMQEGRYPELFAPDSFAVWVDQSVAEYKYRQAVDDGVEVDPALKAAALHISQDYIVFECHLASVFGDMSIAYDVVGLRGITAYLLTPDGSKISPIQTIIGTHAEEEPVGALKRFERTDLIVFSKRDFWLGDTYLDPELDSVRLVLDGFNSTFYFDWPAAAEPPADSTGWMPQAEEAARVAQVGFVDLFDRLKRLAGNFH